MRSFGGVLIGCLVLATIGSVVAEKSNEEQLANLVCKTSSGSKSHITSLASLNGVIGYLSGLPSGHKLESCREKYLESLQQLVHVVEAASNDVCGEEKLALLEIYHRRYISKVSKHEKERKHKGKAPKLAKLFFMQYASKVSSICEQSALSLLSAHKFTINEDKWAKMEKLKKFTDMIGMTEFSKGYKGSYLFWNMVDTLSLSRRDKFIKYFSDARDARLNIQVKKAKDLSELQAYCRHQLKPVYSRSLLPVLRLVDLGYYPESSGLLNNAKNLLHATQVCETLLPVGIYSNENLKDKEVVALTRDEASQLSPYKLEGSTEESAIAFDAAPSSLRPEELSFIDTNCEQVKENVAYRGRVISRMLKKLAKRLGNLKSLIKGFKLLHRGQSQKLEVIDEDEIGKITEQSLQVIEREEAGLTRKKRDFGATVLIVIVVIVIVFFVFLIFRAALSSSDDSGYYGGYSGGGYSSGASSGGGMNPALAVAAISG